MKRIKLILRFIQYYFRAKTLYKVHSPFVFGFCEQILEENEQYYYAFDDLEKLRKDLFNNHNKIRVTDFGAGSHVNNGKERAISSIAKSAVSPAFQSRLLFKIIHLFQPKTMLEFGTSLGLTALYQSTPNKRAHFISLEGCPNISKVAKENWKKMDVSNIDIITGEFNNTLPRALEQLNPLDYVFFDGNHQKKPTLEYFEKCLKNAHDNSIFIFDDIHWSDGMEDAWNEIIIHPRVSLSIDLFFMGIVFFRKENKEKEHFTLIPSDFKFWQRYL